MTDKEAYKAIINRAREIAHTPEGKEAIEETYKRLRYAGKNEEEAKKETIEHVYLWAIATLYGLTGRSKRQ